MTIFDTRRANAMRLIGTERGALSHFATRMGMTKQQASHILGSKPIKNIGNDIARRIEQVYSIPIGSLDMHPEHRGVPSDFTEAQLLPEVAGVGASESYAHKLTLSNDWVRRNLAITPEHVAILPAHGDTMAPTIIDGDLCLLDRSATRVDRDGVYAILREQDIHILRAARHIEGGINFSCDNQAYASHHVQDPIRAGLLILGRVLMTMRPNRL